MRDLIILFLHVIVTIVRLARRGGIRSVIAESVLLKHQLLILNRSRQRAPNLQILDRLIAGFCSLFIRPTRLIRTAITLKPSTLLNFHRALVQRKYRLLFSPKHRTKPGPKGPDADIVRVVIEMKRHNPTWGCPRIADQINLAFDTCINKDVVRRILALHYKPLPNSGGPSWLFIGHMKDSLWSVDLLRCESITLRTHWILIVMDQYTRRIIGFGVQAGVVDGTCVSWSMTSSRKSILARICPMRKPWWARKRPSKTWSQCRQLLAQFAPRQVRQDMGVRGSLQQRIQHGAARDTLTSVATVLSLIPASSSTRCNRFTSRARSWL
jgi:putative transposase